MIDYYYSRYFSETEMGPVWNPGELSGRFAGTKQKYFFFIIYNKPKYYFISFRIRSNIACEKAYDKQHLKRLERNFCLINLIYSGIFRDVCYLLLK